MKRSVLEISDVFAETAELLTSEPCVVRFRKTLHQGGAGQVTKKNSVNVVDIGTSPGDAESLDTLFHEIFHIRNGDVRETGELVNMSPGVFTEKIYTHAEMYGEVTASEYASNWVKNCELLVPGGTNEEKLKALNTLFRSVFGSVEERINQTLKDVTIKLV
jgi:hypothetical protein